MKNAFYTVGFMLAVSAVFALVLSLANAFYLPTIEANDQIDEMRDILYVLQLDPDGDADAIQTRYDDAVETISSPIGDIHARRDEGGAPVAYAVPFTGAGLWGSMRGYIGVNAELDEMTGLAFTEHSETPGLGGRIDEMVYREQFIGLPIASDTRLAYGAAGGETIDAITGATSTSNAVLSILNRVLSDNLPEVEVAVNG